VGRGGLRRKRGVPVSIWHSALLRFAIWQSFCVVSCRTYLLSDHPILYTIPNRDAELFSAPPGSEIKETRFVQGCDQHLGSNRARNMRLHDAHSLLLSFRSNVTEGGRRWESCREIWPGPSDLVSAEKGPTIHRKGIEHILSGSGRHRHTPQGHGPRAVKRSITWWQALE
jgi:hypothetical protein